MVNIVKKFIESNGWAVFWTMHYNSDNNMVLQKYGLHIQTQSSIMDHFVGNSQFYNSVVDADVIHSVDNHSNHLPIYAKFNVNQPKLLF